MAKPKTQTREERLRKKRLAEKKRYERIKNNENLWKEKQEKNKQNYIRRKEEKKQLPIKEMTPRQQKLQRKRWRKNYKSYYLRKKQEKRTAQLLAQNTPPQSPSPILSDTEMVVALQDNIRDTSPLENSFLNKEPDSPISGPSRILRSMSQQSNSTNLVRRLRYKKDKEIQKLKQIMTNLKRQNECLRKKLQRMTNKKECTLTSDNNKNKMFPNKNKMILNKNKMIPNQSLKSLPELLKKEVESFYQDDENSRLCSGKKEFLVRNKVRKQKRYLSDNLLNLHKKFLKSSNFTISYSAFCKLRPFWVLIPDSRSRETCLCKLHTNMDLIVQGLYQRKIIPAKTSRDLLSLLCCDAYDSDCLHRTCSSCQNKVVCYQEFDNSNEITYWQWETKQDLIQGTGRKIRTTEKIKKREEPKKCIENFESTLNEYLMHCGNIVAQQNSFRNLKERLQENECIVHIDFSENYAVKCNEEIQSYHFGGSRKQLTLHTSVIYFLDDEKKQQVQSFCTVSECLRHDISAVWAHIVPILEYIGETKTDIQTIHFISDSPSSQYRNKKIFHVISSLHIYLNSIQTITWNYSESGHGKGAPDGIGATLKRTADRAISHGHDIKGLDDFLNIMDKNLKKIKLKTVSEYDVTEKDFLFPRNVKGFPGCMKMHQLVWNIDSPVIAVRKLSCIDKNGLYKAVNCNHKKHLGFYNLIDGCQKDFSVTLLADSKRQLREIGESFWTTRYVSEDANQKTNQTNNTPIYKGKGIRSSENERTRIEKDSKRKINQILPGQKQKVTKRMGKIIQENENELRKTPKKALARDNNIPTEQKKTLTEQSSNANQDYEDEEFNIFDIPNKSNFLKSLGLNNSNRKQFNITEANEEKRLRNKKAEENLKSAECLDSDSISEITFSRDGSKKFSIDLENLAPYLMDSDDDDIF